MTQLDILKRAFNRGERLTVLSALSRYGVYALSQRCGDLISAGYPIEKSWRTTTPGKRIRQYQRARK